MNRNRIFTLVLVALLPAVVFAHYPADPSNGQIFVPANGNWKAWDAKAGKWVSPDKFWQNYADSKGGLTWGRTSEYPEYKKVKEHDTLLIEVEGGTCLLEFFHTRWRRANDVRRWDDKFNEYSGCADAFK